MKRIFFVFLIALSFGFDKVELHPIHISIAEVDYFTEKKEIQVALRIFTDDLEKAISDNGVKLNLDSSKEIKKSDEYINVYIEKCFRIYANPELNNDLLKMSYLGKEYEEASTWLYFSYKTGENINKLEIHNKVVFDVYDDQKNIVNVRKNRKLVKTVFTNLLKKAVVINLE